jgi:hypothetical protein
MCYKKIFFNVLFIFLVTLCNKSVQAQSYIDYSLLNAQNYYNAETQLYIDTIATNVLTAVKPFVKTNVVNTNANDNKKYLYRKLLRDDFIIVKDSNASYLRLNPIINFTFTKDSAPMYQNTRGIYANGKLGKHLEFNTWFTENQALLPSYLGAYAKATEVIPGQGRYKAYKKTGVDYTNASGYITYIHNRFVAQAGSGKQRIGDGYRSLFMSANALNYPFMRVSYSYKKLFYQVQYALLTNIDLNRYLVYTGSTEPYFDKSALTTHVLGTSLFNNKIQITLFDATQTEASFNTSNNRFNFKLINPFITLVPAITNNSGLNVKYVFVKKAYVYAQWSLPAVNEGLQVGIKSFDSFTIKGLTVQAEYTSNTAKQSSILHYNQAIAHPWNYNYEEIYTAINYVSNIGIGANITYNNLKPQNSLVTTNREGQLSNIASNNASGTHPSYFNNINSQTILRATLFYIPNKSNYLTLSASIEQRKNTGSKNYNSNYITVGVQCKLSDVFTDF